MNLPNPYGRVEADTYDGARGKGLLKRASLPHWFEMLAGVVLLDYTRGDQGRELVERADALGLAARNAAE